MLASVFCSDTPQTHLVATAVSVLSMAALAGLWLRRPSANRNAITIGVALFLIAIATSLPVALYHGTTLFDWGLRGAAPLSFLAAFFFISIKTADDVTFVFRVILACTAFWAMLVAWDLAAAYEFLPTHRWTIHSDNLKLPYNIVGIAIILYFSRTLSDAIALPLLFVLLLLTIGAGYRSHFIIVAGMILGHGAHVMLRAGNRRRIVSIVAVALLAMGAFAAISRLHPDTSSASTGASSCAVTGERAMKRGPLDIHAGDTGRALENRFAVDNFLESPIVGKGLAYAVPSNLIFSGQEAYLQCVETLHGKKYPYVYYLHNFATYVAMTMGILGLAALGLIAVGAFSSLYGVRIASLDQRMAAFVALAALGLFSLVGAAFTLPQFHLLLASFAAVLAAQPASACHSKI